MFDYFANPSRFMRIANRLLLPLVILSVITGIIGYILVYLLRLPIISKAIRFASSIFMFHQHGWPCSAMLGWGCAAFFMLFGGTRLPILPRGQLPRLGRFLPF